MTTPKLAKLPDRTPVKLTVTINPDLNRRLTRYADHYNKSYGNTEAEPVTELVPFMLEHFLDSDKAFVRAEKKGGQDNENAAHPEETTARTPRRSRGADGASAGQ